MNRTATLLLAGAVAAVAVAPAIGHGESRVYVPPKDSKSQLGYRDIPGLNWRDVAKHYAPAKSIDDWRKLHSERHWKEGYSAYQIAHAWESANPKLPPEIAALFYGPVELLAAIPEHKTPLPGGRAPSQSDLLAFIRIQNRVCAVTVEGKKEEGFGSTVGEWSENASTGKIKRLKHIAAKLGLAYPPAGEIRYQLLHRAAAAVIEAERFNADCAATLVHSFSPQHESFGDFATFLSAFGIRSAKQDKIYKTDKPGIDLYFGWASPAGAVASAPAPAKPNPQPAQVAEVTALSPAAPIKSQSSLLGGNFVWIVSVVLVVLVLAGIFFWTRNRRELDATVKTAQPVETAPAQAAEADDLAATVNDTKMIDANKVKGDEFEEYVIRKFNVLTESEKKDSYLDRYGRHILLEHRNDKWKDGVSAESNKYPDLEIGCYLSQSDNPYKFAVECKFRSDYDRKNGKVQFVSQGKLADYREYERENDIPTFIVLGLGGYPDDPQQMFVIPLNRFNENDTAMTLEELALYKQPGKKKSFFYHCMEKWLKFN